MAGEGRPSRVFLSPACPEALRRDAFSLQDFDVCRRLGSGCFSVVLQTIDRKSGLSVALKCYKKEAIQEGSLQERQVQREIEIQGTFSHPNILKLFGAFESDTHLTVMFETAPGGDLFHELRRRGRFDDISARGVVTQLISALEAMHQRRILHRDIKPENVLLFDSGVVKLADFGLAIDSRIERAVSRIGTLAFMPPEVLQMPDKSKPEENKGYLGYDQRSDIWSLGILCYELLVGSAPWGLGSKRDTIDAIMGAVPVQIPETVGKEARDFIERCLQRDPEQRPSAADLKRHAWLRGFTGNRAKFGGRSHRRISIDDALGQQRQALHAMESQRSRRGQMAATPDRERERDRDRDRERDRSRSPRPRGGAGDAGGAGGAAPPAIPVALSQASTPPSSRMRAPLTPHTARAPRGDRFGTNLPDDELESERERERDWQRDGAPSPRSPRPGLAGHGAGGAPPVSPPRYRSPLRPAPDREEAGPSASPQLPGIDRAEPGSWGREHERERNGRAPDPEASAVGSLPHYAQPLRSPRAVRQLDWTQQSSREAAASPRTVGQEPSFGEQHSRRSRDPTPSAVPGTPPGRRHYERSPLSSPRPPLRAGDRDLEASDRFKDRLMDSDGERPRDPRAYDRYDRDRTTPPPTSSPVINLRSPPPRDPSPGPSSALRPSPPPASPRPVSTFLTPTLSSRAKTKSPLTGDSSRRLLLFAAMGGGVGGPVPYNVGHSSAGGGGGAAAPDLPDPWMKLSTPPPASPPPLAIDEGGGLWGSGGVRGDPDTLPEDLLPSVPSAANPLRPGNGSSNGNTPSRPLAPQYNRSATRLSPGPASAGGSNKRLSPCPDKGPGNEGSPGGGGSHGPPSRRLTPTLNSASMPARGAGAFGGSPVAGSPPNSKKALIASSDRSVNALSSVDSAKVASTASGMSGASGSGGGGSGFRADTSASTNSLVAAATRSADSTAQATSGVVGAAAAAAAAATKSRRLGGIMSLRLHLPGSAAAAVTPAPGVGGPAPSSASFPAKSLHGPGSGQVIMSADGGIGPSARLKKGQATNGDPIIRPSRWASATSKGYPGLHLEAMQGMRGPAGGPGDTFSGSGMAGRVRDRPRAAGAGSVHGAAVGPSSDAGGLATASMDDDYLARLEEGSKLARFMRMFKGARKAKVQDGTAPGQGNLDDGL